MLSLYNINAHGKIYYGHLLSECEISLKQNNIKCVKINSVGGIRSAISLHKTRELKWLTWNNPENKRNGLHKGRVYSTLRTLI